MSPISLMSPISSMPETVGAPQPGHAGKKARVRRLLIVDDEEFLLEELAEFLNDEGYHVDPAPNGAEALSLLAASPDYALLLCDLRMKDIDGFEVISAARAMAPRLPVIAMSGHATEGDIHRTRTLGCLSFLEKPFTVNQLLQVIEAVLPPAD